MVVYNVPFFLGLYALGVIRYFVWLDFSFCLLGAKIHFLGNIGRERIEKFSDCTCSWPELFTFAGEKQMTQRC